jgi:hypothetical protein
VNRTCLKTVECTKSLSWPTLTQSSCRFLFDTWYFTSQSYHTISKKIPHLKAAYTKYIPGMSPSPPPHSNLVSKTYVVCTRHMQFLINHKLNMKLDLQSLFGLHVHSCTHWLRPRNLTHPMHLGSYTRALLVSQDRQHLFVTPCCNYAKYTVFKYTSRQ